MKRLLGLSICAAMLMLPACSSKSQEETREQMNKAGDDAKKAGAELKKDAKELSHNIDKAVTPDSKDAGAKLSEGKEKLEAAGNKASVKLSEAALIAEVKTKLASDAGLSTMTGIDVDAAASGVVTLKGHVATQAQKDAADHAAAAVDGVTRVQNELSVGQ